MLEVNESYKKVTAQAKKNNSRVLFYATGNYRQDRRNETAHAMKNGERWAIFKAAAEMVKYIPSNAALVPMPSHSGQAPNGELKENSWSVGSSNVMPSASNLVLKR